MTGRDPVGPGAAPSLRGLRILVVEDTFLVADVIVDHLQECGCEVVGPAARVGRALALAKTEQLDGALLDVNLAGEYCFPVAAMLAERNIWFAFLTGYGEGGLPPQFHAAPRLNKPFESSDLVRLLSQQFLAA